MSNEKQLEIKKRGRPPLPEEERKLRQQESKNRYKARNPHKVTECGTRAREKYSEVKLLVPRELRPELDNLAKSEGVTITELFFNAIEDKHGIRLTKSDS